VGLDRGPNKRRAIKRGFVAPERSVACFSVRPSERLFFTTVCPSSLIEIFFFFVFSFESGNCFLERLFVLKLLFF
jgi:hypothetical protein